jgi:uncharacterized protein YeaO (DUF488 family)
MSKPIRLKTFQIGTPVKPGEGLRIAVTRRPPRGVPKADWNRVGCFDVWFPTLAPSNALLAKRRNLNFEEASVRKAFFDSYEKSLLASTESRQAAQLIAKIASRTPVSIGCFCADESRCHRSRLYKVIMSLAEGA